MDYHLVKDDKNIYFSKSNAALEKAKEGKTPRRFLKW